VHSMMYRGSLLHVDTFHRTLFEHGIQQILIKKKKKKKDILMAVL